MWSGRRVKDKKYMGLGGPVALNARDRYGEAIVMLSAWPHREPHPQRPSYLPEHWKLISALT